MGESATATNRLSAGIQQAVSGLDFGKTHGEYWEQNECVFVERFLPADLVEATLVPEVQRLRPQVHRNYIPGHKKGGSISAFTLSQKAPIFLTLYTSPEFLAFLSRLVGARLLLCPDNDPHACALYYYTEPGDHIGYHYDTSHYQGARYTVLLGLVQRSERCRLVAQLHKDDPTRKVREISLAYGPGDLVVFNGNKLWHAVTPLANGEERVVLTLEYVTNQQMALPKRIFSNLKDAFAYFGPSALWPRRRPRP
ncbi:MAG: 2OG-Fe(II) oxygenase [Candidatus Methylomirabilota bacterium]